MTPRSASENIVPIACSSVVRPLETSAPARPGARASGTEPPLPIGERSAGRRIVLLAQSEQEDEAGEDEHRGRGNPARRERRRG